MASSSLRLYYMHDRSIYTVNHVIHFLNEAAIIIKAQPYIKRLSLSLPRKFCLYHPFGINLDGLICMLSQSEVCNWEPVVMITAIKITYHNLSTKIMQLCKRIHKLI
jgi:hypothetical protein